MHSRFFLHGVACHAIVKISKTGIAGVQNVCSSVPSKDDVAASCPCGLVMLCAVAASCQLQGLVHEVILLMIHLTDVTFLSTNLQGPLLVPAPQQLSTRAGGEPETCAWTGFADSNLKTFHAPLARWVSKHSFNASSREASGLTYWRHCCWIFYHGTDVSVRQ